VMCSLPAARTPASTVRDRLVVVDQPAVTSRCTVVAMTPFVVEKLHGHPFDCHGVRPRPARRSRRRPPASPPVVHGHGGRRHALVGGDVAERLGDAPKSDGRSRDHVFMVARFSDHHPIGKDTRTARSWWVFVRLRRSSSCPRLGLSARSIDAALERESTRLSCSLETPTTHMQVQAVMVLDPVDRAGGYCVPEDQGAPGVPPAPPARVPAAAGVRSFDLHRPVWFEDPDFDIDYHVRHISRARAGPPEQLADIVGDIAGVRSTARDRCGSSG